MSEALRLAKALNSESESQVGYVKYSTAKKSSRELVRLDKENKAMLDQLMRMQVVKEMMLEALIAIEPFIPKSSAKDGGAVRHSAYVIAADVVRAAIVKAEKA